MILQELKKENYHLVLLCIYLNFNVSKHNAYEEMCNSMEKKMKNSNIYRLDVRFNIKATNVNTVFGREAHLLFLKNEILIKIILLRYNYLYK